MRRGPAGSQAFEYAGSCAAPLRRKISPGARDIRGFAVSPLQMPSRANALLSLLVAAALPPSCAGWLLGVDDDNPAGGAGADGGIIASVHSSLKPGVDGSCPSAFKKCGELCVSVLNPAYGCSASACGSACPAPPGDGTAVCEANACKMQCVSGFHADGANCAPDAASVGAGTWRVVPSGTTRALRGI